MAATPEGRRSLVRGCLLGLAVGDAYGAPVEFLRRRQILERFGPDGPRGLEPWGGHPGGSYTDDTQMSMATARGLLDWRAASGWSPGAALDQSALEQAIRLRYLEWYRSHEWDGRAPGTACLTALGSGTPVDSKGCGGVMRVAPLGCAGLGRAAFEAGARAAALTHRHHTSDAAAGFQARLVDWLVGDGGDLRAAVAAARATLAAWPEPGGALDAVDTAIALAGDASVETYEALGQIGHAGIERPDERGKGWVAEEALGIGLFCALRFSDDFAAALRAAAVISGDSDSTASIAGAILGAAGGTDAIPAAWRDEVEGRDELVRLADALAGGEVPAS